MLNFFIINLICATASLAFNPNSSNVHPDAGLNIHSFTKKYGYPLENHTVKTEDGYLLTMHRIPHGRTKNIAKTIPVLLMHGLLSSSIDYINMGPGKGLGLMLADQGYDVWLGNQRGNTWSRNHLTLNPEKDGKKFFDFSFHEIGFYDLPAKIDYILNKTKSDQLFYIGHSQGTTTFFVMCAERPEYNEKIKLMIALAPVAYMTNFPNPFLKLLNTHLDFLTVRLQMYELMPHLDVVTDFAKILCNNESEYQETCVYVLNILGGFDDQIDPDFTAVIGSNDPAGASVKQVLHYMQEISSRKFCQFDYGSAGNLEKYGGEPPSYNISKIVAPINSYYAENDWLTAVEDIQQLEKELPNLRKSKKIPFEQFNHLDFLWAKDVDELLNNDVLEDLQGAK